MVNNQAAIYETWNRKLNRMNVDRNCKIPKARKGTNDTEYAVTQIKLMIR